QLCELDPPRSVSLRPTQHIVTASMSQWLDRADYVARLKELASKQVATASPSVLLPPPEPILARLKDEFQLYWDDLPPLAHQALLWDSGYIVATDGASSADPWVQVRLPCDSSRQMQDIALSPNTFPGTTQLCASSTGSSYLRSTDSAVADAKLFASRAKCGVFIPKGLNIATSTASMYSQDALAAAVVPEPRIFMHASVPVIHTTPDASKAESPAGTCPRSGGGMTIPCRPILQENDPMFCFPLQSQAMKVWLKDLQQTTPSIRPSTSPPSSTSSPSAPLPASPLPRLSDLSPSLPPPINPQQNQSSNLLGYLGGGGGGLVLVVLLFVVVRYGSKRSRQLEWDRAQFHQPPPTARFSHHVNPGEPSAVKTKPRGVYDLVLSPLQTTLRPPRHSASPTYSVTQDINDNNHNKLASMENEDIIETDPMRRLFQLPRHFKLPIEALAWEVILDKTATAEIYYGQYQQYHAIALKILRVDAAQDAAVVRSFVQDVVCAATCWHAFLVPFVGFGFDDVTHSPSSVVAVTEYCSQGTLRSFLRADLVNLHWSLKATLALQVAQGLQYLHARNVVHGNVTAQSVWIDWPTAKLSPLHIDSSSTGSLVDGIHVAPELRRQDDGATAASDVYAFGALLCELDMQMPLQGRPSIGRMCPEQILAIVQHCMDTLPRKRPTMAQVVDALDATSANLDGDCSGFV
ncbi:hypothetical protein DYB34_008619, partial [Aphanomyces astaci]